MGLSNPETHVPFGQVFAVGLSKHRSHTAALASCVDYQIEVILVVGHVIDVLGEGPLQLVSRLGGVVLLIGKLTDDHGDIMLCKVNLPLWWPVRRSISTLGAASRRLGGSLKGWSEGALLLAAFSARTELWSARWLTSGAGLWSLGCIGGAGGLAVTFGLGFF